MLYYAASTGGFYDSAIHGSNIPADAVEITQAEHTALFDGQSAGKIIVPDAKGKPVAADPPAPTNDELAATIRAERNARIAACDWTQTLDCPLSAQAKAAWAAYRQALRDVPEQAGFPQAVDWPKEP
jgi:hypothetical protein